MNSENTGLVASHNSGKDYNFKKLCYISEEYAAYVEIKMDAKVVDKNNAEYDYDQQDMIQSTVFKLISQGEIKLKSWMHILGIDFSFFKKDHGFELTLEWANFGDDYGYQMYNSKEKITVSIPVGSSTISDLKIEYSEFPEPHEGQNIYLTIIEANINLLISTQLEDYSLRNDFDEIFVDNKTINIGTVYGKKRGRLGY